MIENPCKIFTILFKNKDPKYNFGSVLGIAENHLQEIAELGGTEHFYNSKDLTQLREAFSKINDAIQNNFGLKLNE